jgi:hypothetical protein
MTNLKDKAVTGEARWPDGGGGGCDGDAARLPAALIRRSPDQTVQETGKAGVTNRYR